MSRPLYEISREIESNWKDIYYGARPYLAAMRALQSVSDRYGYDDGKSIVRYFLANAKTWRGDDARRIKAELKALAGIK